MAPHGTAGGPRRSGRRCAQAAARHRQRHAPCSPNGTRCAAGCRWDSEEHAPREKARTCVVMSSANRGGRHACGAICTQTAVVRQVGADAPRGSCSTGCVACAQQPPRAFRAEERRVARTDGGRRPREAPRARSAEQPGRACPSHSANPRAGGARVRQVEQAMDMPESHRKCHLHAQVQRVTAQWPRKRRLEPACMRRIWPAACLVVSFSGTTVVRHARRDCLVTRQLHAQVSAFSECAGSCTNTRTKSRLCTWCMRPERLSCTYSGAFAASCCDGQAALHSTAQQTQHGGARRATRTTSPATHKPAPAALLVAPTQAGCGE